MLRSLSSRFWQMAGSARGTLTGEKLLLQGVVDCCFMEEDGITVLTSKRTGSDLGARRSRPPAMADRSGTYGQALSRILASR